MRWIGLLLPLLVSPALAEDYITHQRWDLTPGVTRDLTVRQICRTKWGEDARAVTAAMKQRIIDAYEFDVKQCPLTTLRGRRVRRLEIDHLIPRSIGGADDEKNLWPQCYEQVKPDKSQQENGAHKKDRLETYIHAQLCKNPSAELLEEYQNRIRWDWVSFYHQVYADETGVGRNMEIMRPTKKERPPSVRKTSQKEIQGRKKRLHSARAKPLHAKTSKPRPAK